MRPNLNIWVALCLRDWFTKPQNHCSSPIKHKHFFFFKSKQFSSGHNWCVFHWLGNVSWPHGIFHDDSCIPWGFIKNMPPTPPPLPFPPVFSFKALDIWGCIKWAFDISQQCTPLDHYQEQSIFDILNIYCYPYCFCQNTFMQSLQSGKLNKHLWSYPTG